VVSEEGSEAVRGGKWLGAASQDERGRFQEAVRIGPGCYLRLYGFRAPRVAAVWPH
jgi:hypothetical protein